MGIICALRCAVGNQSEFHVARAINPVLQGCKSPLLSRPPSNSIKSLDSINPSDIFIFMIKLQQSLSTVTVGKPVLKLGFLLSSRKATGRSVFVLGHAYQSNIPAPRLALETNRCLEILVLVLVLVLVLHLLMDRRFDHGLCIIVLLVQDLDLLLSRSRSLAAGGTLLGCSSRGAGGRITMSTFEVAHDGLAEMLTVAGKYLDVMNMAMGWEAQGPEGKKYNDMRKHGETYEMASLVKE